MCSVSRKIGAVFCTFGVILMFLAGLMLNVSAADTEIGSLALTCKYDEQNIPGMTWQIYNIGEKRGSSYVLTGDFADYPIDLSKIMEDSESMTEAASTLSNYAVLGDIYPTQIGRTNNSGVVRFSGLDKGLYLAVGNKVKIDSVTYFPTPLLFEIGGDINAYPKFITKSTLPGQIDRFTMRKIWVNASIATDMPETLKVEIYEDGELFDTVQLNASDNWTYSWEGSADSEWKVKEVSVPAGCFVMYRNNEYQFVIMNSYDNDLLARVTTTTSTATTATTVTTVTQPDSETTAPTTSKTEDGYENSRTTSTTTVATDVMPGSSTVSGETETTTTVVTNTTEDGGSASRTGTTTTAATDVIPASSTVSGETETTTATDTSSSTGSGTVTTRKTSSVSNSTRSSKNTTVTTTTGKLPQTGQLWWPVPVMLFSGLVFVAVGLRLLVNSRKED